MLRPQQTQVPLYGANEGHLAMLAQQGNSQLTQAALAEMMSAQQGMQQVAAQKNLEVPKVNFYPSKHADPHKARKRDIRQAYRLLQPAKRSWLSPMRWAGNKYRYNKDTGVCVVDGCDCAELIRHENLYERICDEETGRSLYEMYWQNPVTGQAEAFIARDKVTSGKKMRGTYCPEHLHLFHLLKKWEAEEDKQNEMNPRRLRDKVKRGVSIVTVPVAAVRSKEVIPPLFVKYEAWFDELARDAGRTKAIRIDRDIDPLTGENDVVRVTFDSRYMRWEMEQANLPTPQFQAMMQQQNLDGSMAPPMGE